MPDRARAGKERPRWYMRMAQYDGPMGAVQVSLRVRRADSESRSWKLPEPILRLAAEEYNRQGYDQSYERLQERGGLGLTEVISLLADAVEHERKGRTDG